MIRLIDVTKYYVTNFGRHYVFRNVNLELPLDRNVGVIGPNGAGKSTFLRLLSGADQPSSGTIIKSGSISPPMGLTPGLQGSLSALENVRFAGRIYGMKRREIDEMVVFVRELAQIGKYFEMPIETYSAGMKQRIAFGINMSMHFDYYLFDEISAGGDRQFRKAAKAMVAERLRTSRFVMTSHDIAELLELCHAGIVIGNGELTYFDDIRDAASFYGEAPDGSKPSKARRRRALSENGQSPDLEDIGGPQSRALNPARRRRTNHNAVSSQEGETRRRRKRARRDASVQSSEPMTLPVNNKLRSRTRRRSVAQLSSSAEGAWQSHDTFVPSAPISDESNRWSPLVREEPPAEYKRDGADEPIRVRRRRAQSKVVCEKEGEFPQSTLGTDIGAPPIETDIAGRRIKEARAPKPRRRREDLSNEPVRAARRNAKAARNEGEAGDKLIQSDQPSTLSAVVMSRGT